ncbi:hypothetical protein [Planococcus shixiaomingii]|uniref:hypothetical protein n=1 Tax=Planococcus shixiaomingii TaxID=3058393 RepID=UPI00260DF8B7|nr:hypothetical protein [Planococcus sp. N022]WKA53453.1 hypothetical protein QWY21_12360 [Planococcus sp. N022]
MFEKGDRVIIHTHRYAKVYRGKVFTCLANEGKWDEEDNYIILKELGPYGKSFFTRYLTKV